MKIIRQKGEAITLDAKMGWRDGLRDLVRRMTSGRYKGRHEGVMPDEESQGSYLRLILISPL